MSTAVMYALLDANVLYPAPLGDYLLRLAATGLFQPAWTAQIHTEWITNLLLNRPDLTLTALHKTKTAMDAAFPDACICGYETLIDTIKLPDANDRHVLAAAIQRKVNVIITANLKDFPAEKLAPYAITALHPDEFVSMLIKNNKGKCVTALASLVRSLKKPPKTEAEVLTTLSTCGLPNSVKLLRQGK